jgi:hypothetical protein
MHEASKLTLHYTLVLKAEGEKKELAGMWISVGKGYSHMQQGEVSPEYRSLCIISAQGCILKAQMSLRVGNVAGPQPLY